MKKDKALNIAIIFTLLAMAAHAYLTAHYYDLKLGGGAGGNAICNVNSYFSCDATTASKYSSLFGVPIAMWGLFANLIALMFFTFARLNLSQDSEKTARYGFLASCALLIASIVMASISTTAIGSLCLFCASTYLFSIVQFAASLKSTPISGKLLTEDIKDIFSTQRWVPISVVIILVLPFLGHSMALDGYGYKNMGRMVDEKVAYWLNSPAQTFNESGLVYQKGTGEPVMTIVEFADFRCHHCKDAYPSLHAFTTSHPDVRLIFKAFPLDGTCNSAITGGDGISCGLAFITTCAEKMGQKGWQAHHLIFDNQKDFQGLPVDAAADKVCKETGLNCDELKQCAKSDETLQMVKSMASEGEKAKIQGTPSVFVNSKLLGGGQLLPVLDAAYKKIKDQ